MIEALERAPNVRRMVYVALADVGMFTLAALIQAIRWW